MKSGVVDTNKRNLGSTSDQLTLTLPQSDPFDDLVDGIDFDDDWLGSISKKEIPNLPLTNQREHIHGLQNKTQMNNQHLGAGMFTDTHGMNMNNNTDVVGCSNKSHEQRLPLEATGNNKETSDLGLTQILNLNWPSQSSINSTQIDSDWDKSMESVHFSFEHKSLEPLLTESDIEKYSA